MLLGDVTIRRLIEEYDLITDYIDLETQLQPTGFELTIKSVETFTGPGCLDFSNEHRVIAEAEELPWNIWSNKFEDKTILLKPLKVYRLNFNETINLRDIPYPISIVSGRRSSLMRSGIISDIGLWDYGYRGKGQSTIFVANPYGYRLYQNARFHQCFFFKAEKASKIYNGKYLNEGIKQ